MKESITLKQVNDCRAEAEKEILDILIKLNKETGLVIQGLTVDDSVMNIIGGVEQVFSGITIDLKI